MKEVVENEESLKLGLSDNGGDLKVSAVSYGRIADLVIQSYQRDTCKRCTVTAMNVDEMGDAQTLDQLQPDKRQFPESLIAQHKKAARFGGLLILLGTGLIIKAAASTVFKIFKFAFG